MCNLKDREKIWKTGKKFKKTSGNSVLFIINLFLTI